MKGMDLLTAGELDVEYPESDGRPMAETGIHVNRMTDLYKMLQGFCRTAPDVYVGANMFLYGAAEAELERLKAEMERLRGR
ncbi:MAG: hypothetical protein HYY20_13705 [Candidatus Tectomicrobia bacterium]|uniref:Uncharacterized protein n=1 Tax=Tectimicrobiota bacterium TaxID=2528274 RepID=A0A932CRQ7_UNCTE|nr:hypothetical protein [Candidatus Tectomicrobia bacterium]